MTGKSLRDELAALIETWRAAVKQSASGYYAVGFDEGQIACADELAAILSASPHDGCTWRQDDEGAHDTDCGQRFQFTDEGAKENGAKFCCYCGKPPAGFGSSYSVGGRFSPRSLSAGSSHGLGRCFVTGSLKLAWNGHGAALGILLWHR